MLLPLLLAADAPGEERVFGDWVVACDNVTRCQAVALHPVQPRDDEDVQLVLTREPGPRGGLSIEIVPNAVEGRVTLVIDDKPVAVGVMADGAVRLSGTEAEGLARAMATGHLLRVRDYRQRRVATVSLAGSSAALRWIDAQQGRTGTLTALVAKGTRPVSAVPAAKPLPTVPAVRAGKGAPVKVAAALLARLAKSQGCDWPLAGRDKAEIARLDARATLVLMPCGSGAYNMNVAAFVVRGGKGAEAAFDTQADAGAMLSNASWDAAKGQLIQYEFGRGLGDCGHGQHWVWDGSRFRMVEETRLGTCRGATSWPVVFRAAPVWR